MLLEVQELTTAEAADEWRLAYLGGRRGLDMVDQEVMLLRQSILFREDVPWVRVRLPIEWLDFDWQDDGPTESKARRALAYAQREGEFPPGVARFSPRTRSRSDTAYVADGNHRGLAATMRGDEDFLVLMPRDDFERLVEAREARASQAGLYSSTASR